MFFGKRFQKYHIDRKIYYILLSIFEISRGLYFFSIKIHSSSQYFMIHTVTVEFLHAFTTSIVFFLLTICHAYFFWDKFIKIFFNSVSRSLSCIMILMDVFLVNFHTMVSFMIWFAVNSSILLVRYYAIYYIEFLINLIVVPIFSLGHISVWELFFSILSFAIVVNVWKLLVLLNFQQRNLFHITKTWFVINFIDILIK